MTEVVEVLEAPSFTIPYLFYNPSCSFLRSNDLIFFESESSFFMSLFKKLLSLTGLGSLEGGGAFSSSFSFFT